MSQIIPIGSLATEIMKGLDEYAALSTEAVKKAVNDAGKTIKEEIAKNAPKRTGKYAKSWTTKKTKETSSALEVTVYSSNRYQLAHLLEFGHATRGGGRVSGRSHIAPAEEKGIEQLEKDIEKALGGI